MGIKLNYNKFKKIQWFRQPRFLKIVLINKVKKT